ncbi:hypothetical protein ACFPJ4_07180 [Lysinimonas soli]|uniref:Uncharacterized protein n=1 Tax=Lysinimonas soli TaxID=1074233 RepID=A0ABW0NP05_9MICO
MMASSIASRLSRVVAAVELLLALTTTLTSTPTSSTVSAAFVVAVLAIVAVLIARALPPRWGGIPLGVGARAALDRMVPRTAQTDPAARGHRRPRAPGRLLPAV